MPLASRLLSFFGVGRRANPLTGGFAPPAPVLSGTFVTPGSALALAPVYAAINVISRDFATLPRFVYRKRPDGGRDIDNSKPVSSLLRVAPNDDMDAFSFFQTILGHVLGWGNGYAEILRDGRGDATDLLLLHPAKTVPKRTDSGKLFYELTDSKKKLLPENVLHLKGLGFDGVRGYSPITVCRQTVGLALGAEQFGASFFGNGAMPKGVLKHPKRLTQAAANNIRGSWNQVHQGSQSAHQIAILEEGLDWVNTQINPDDGQWIATREFQVKDIARLYSLPPHKIGDYSESHLANVEEANLDYVATTLAGWVTMVEAQLNLKLLTAAGRETFEIAVDMEAILRTNIEARMKRIQTMRNVGAWSVDDIRRFERMNPIGPRQGGDLYVVQGQYVPLKDVGKVPPRPAPAPGPSDPPPDDDTKAKTDAA